jgi:hypothetical protein
MINLKQTSLKEDYLIFLDIINSNNQLVDKEKVKQVLIIFQPEVFFLGDTFIQIDKLKVCRSWFKNASITLNFIGDAGIYRSCQAFLENNQYLDEFAQTELTDIRFDNYDVIICASYKEKEILEVVFEQCRHRLYENKIKTCIFSFSANLLYDYEGIVPFSPGNLVDDNFRTVFPGYNDLLEYAFDFFSTNVLELNITDEEKKWAEQWLGSNGFKEDESLFIFLDAASRKDKLLRLDVYFDVLQFVLNKNKTRILIFDEKGIGKMEIYTEWLGEATASKIIFADRLPLRKVLCLFSAANTKMIFGPCTGLLHCASGIYNSMRKKGMAADKVPLLITYTGECTHKEKNNGIWWGNRSPLVNCLLIKTFYGKATLCMIHQLSEEEKTKTSNVLPVTDYTADMLINFIDARLKS